MMRVFGAMRATFVAVAFVAASVSASGVSSADPPGHEFRTWTEAEAANASPLTGAEAARDGSSADPEAAREFADRVSSALGAVEAEVGEGFVSAAIDPSVGTRLVVRVTDRAAAGRSAALAALDADGGEVRIVVQRGNRRGFEAQMATARTLVGQTFDGGLVVAAAPDDMTARVVVTVSGDANRARAEIQRRVPSAVVVAGESAQTLDGGVWGNNPDRAEGPVAGGSSISGGCTSALPATRGGVNVLVTAGHCVYGRAPSVSLASLAGNVSPAIGNWFHQRSYGDTTDEALIEVTNHGPPRNCIITQFQGCRPIAQSAHGPVQGEPVVKTGATTGETAGVITARDVAAVACARGGSPCINLQHAIDASNAGDFGDSGGVLYRDQGGSVDPLGITSAIHAGGTTYTNWRLACPSMGLDNCPAAGGSGIGAVAHDGVEDIFYLGQQGEVLSRRRFSTGTWSGAMSLAGLARSDPAAASSGPGRADVFALGADFRVYFRSVLHNVPQAGWAAIHNGQGNSAPAAVSWGAGRLDVFVRGLDNALWWTSRASATAPWAQWQSLGGILGSAPAVSSWAGGRLDVFAVGIDRALWHRFYQAGYGWGPWESFGGTHTADPGAASWGGNRIDVISRGSDNQAYHAFWGPGWYPYRPVQGNLATGVDVIAPAFDRLSAFARGVDGRIYRQHWNGGSWSGWGLLPNQ